MSVPALFIDRQRKGALDAGFMAAFGCLPERYFPLPDVPKLAATIRIISVAVFWRRR